MEIVDRNVILRYLHITLLSYSRICYYTPVKDLQKRIKIRFSRVAPNGVWMKLAEVPKNLDGFVMFYSYTFIFRFRTELRADSEFGLYYCEIPPMIETYDRRKYARLKFESRENKVVSIYNKSFNTRSQGILTDISAGGIGFCVVDPRHTPNPGDLVMTEIRLKNKDFQVIAEVIQVRNDHIGCAFLEKSIKFQLELNAIVKEEVDWRSELMLKNLKKREEWLKDFQSRQEPESKTKQALVKKLDHIVSLVEYFSGAFHSVANIVLSQHSLEYKESTVPGELIFLFFNVYFNSEPVFRGYFCTNDDVLYKLAQPVFDSDLAGRGINSFMVLEQLGKRLEAYSGRPGNSCSVFTLTGLKTLQANKRLHSELLQLPSIQVTFDSSLGPFFLSLTADNLEHSLNLCHHARTREFITMEKMDLIEPISYSTLKVFSEFLKLEIREKSVNIRDRLLPRFEVSVLLDIFFNDIDGKVILNLSKKLALRIYEILLDETATDFNNEVKDAIAEITNMITGNAKSEFENHGIYYKISTPVVLESREGVMIYARNMKFLSSVYWTSEGFFDLSFSFFKR